MGSEKIALSFSVLPSKKHCDARGRSGRGADDSAAEEQARV
jgi:hypothetical protein